MAERLNTRTSSIMRSPARQVSERFIVGALRQIWKAGLPISRCCISRVDLGDRGRRYCRRARARSGVNVGSTGHLRYLVARARRRSRKLRGPSTTDATRKSTDNPPVQVLQRLPRPRTWWRSPNKYSPMASRPRTSEFSYYTFGGMRICATARKQRPPRSKGKANENAPNNVESQAV
jgi:hypothetical protein